MRARGAGSGFGEARPAARSASRVSELSRQYKACPLDVRRVLVINTQVSNKLSLAFSLLSRSSIARKYALSHKDMVFSGVALCCAGIYLFFFFLIFDGVGFWLRTATVSSKRECVN